MCFISRYLLSLNFFFSFLVWKWNHFEVGPWGGRRTWRWTLHAVVWVNVSSGWQQMSSGFVILLFRLLKLVNFFIMKSKLRSFFSVKGLEIAYCFSKPGLHCSFAHWNCLHNCFSVFCVPPMLWRNYTWLYFLYPTSKQR